MHDERSISVHIVGAGPVGLMLAALFQPLEGFSVHLYEKRREYTRTRMVQLRDYLVADSVASYCTDYIDGESVEALFDAAELQEGLAFRQSIPPDLMALLVGASRAVEATANAGARERVLSVVLAGLRAPGNG